jgi:hypothetical protein
MDLKEYQLFTSPVWEVTNQIDADTLKDLTGFAYDCVKKYPLDTPVSKRNGFNSIPLSINHPALTNILQMSIGAVKEQYEPSVEMRLEKYWININPPGAYNIRHTHPRTVLACTLYLQTPENGGDIVFYNPNPAALFANYSNKRAHYNFSEFRITPTPGLFVACPGWLDHSVDTNTSDTDRISISMNIVERR